MCVFCHTGKSGAFYDVDGRNFYICNKCSDNMIRKDGNRHLESFYPAILDSTDYVLVLGDRGTGRKTVCSKLFNAIDERNNPIVLYDCSHGISDAVPRYGSAVITTVVPSKDSKRDPTYIIFTPPHDDGWASYPNIIHNICNMIYSITRDLENDVHTWQRTYPRLNFVVNVSTGYTYVMQ